MAEMTIQLRIDPNTGKKDIVISLDSDADMLPHEHEEQHRKLVEKLIEGGMIQASELGKIVVQREEETPLPASRQETAEGESESQTSAIGH
jgi:FtsH ternary system domain X3-analog